MASLNNFVSPPGTHLGDPEGSAHQSRPRYQDARDGLAQGDAGSDHGCSQHSEPAEEHRQSPGDVGGVEAMSR